jgi:UDPglucose 6-dehydrogenase
VALKQLAANSGYPFQLLSAVIEVNDLQRRRAVNRLKDEIGGLSGKTVALLGLTFKAQTDDMREAPSTVIAARLLAEGATVRCWDPMARLPHNEPWTLTTRHASPLEAVDGADAAMIITEWPELREVSWERARAAMAGSVLLDGRNVLDPAAMAAAGFTYLSVGRATARS